MPAANPYEILGVAPDASSDEVRIAYRRRASETHPDRQGGDDTRMAQVNEAYALLSDPERRKRFDETGRSDARPSVDDEALQALATVFRSALDQDAHGVVQFAQLATQQSRREIVRARASAVAKKDRLAQKRVRVRVSGEAENLVHAIVDAQIAALAKQIDALDRAVLVADAVAKLLDAYEEDAPAPERAQAWSTFGAIAGWGT